MNPLVVAVGLLAVGVWLKSRPDCDSGCQTVAEHLIRHVLSRLLGGA